MNGDLLEAIRREENAMARAEKAEARVEELEKEVKEALEIGSGGGDGTLKGMVEGLLCDRDAERVRADKTIAKLAAATEFIGLLHVHISEATSQLARKTGDEAFHGYLVLSEIQKQFFNPWPPECLDVNVEVTRVTVEPSHFHRKLSGQRCGDGYRTVDEYRIPIVGVEPGDALLLMKRKR